MTIERKKERKKYGKKKYDIPWKDQKMVKIH